MNELVNEMVAAVDDGDGEIDYDEFVKMIQKYWMKTNIFIVGLLLYNVEEQCVSGHKYVLYNTRAYIVKKAIIIPKISFIVIVKYTWYISTGVF